MLEKMGERQSFGPRTATPTTCESSSTSLTLLSQHGICCESRKASLCSSSPSGINRTHDVLPHLENKIRGDPAPFLQPGDNEQEVIRVTSDQKASDCQRVHDSLLHLLRTLSTVMGQRQYK